MKSLHLSNRLIDLKFKSKATKSTLCIKYFKNNGRIMTMQYMKLKFRKKILIFGASPSFSGGDLY